MGQSCSLFVLSSYPNISCFSKSSFLWQNINLFCKESNPARMILSTLGGDCLDLQYRLVLQLLMTFTNKSGQSMSSFACPCTMPNVSNIRKFESQGNGSVTIFWGKFATLAKFLNSLAILRILFGIWQTFKPTLVTFYAIGQIFIVVNGQKRKHNLAIWSPWQTATTTFHSIDFFYFLGISSFHLKWVSGPNSVTSWLYYFSIFAHI